ncbi:MAG TPA: hypothetical protein VJ550_00935 [Geomonas sp.]|nr:hypothetical protein [Geomonas sp.]
MKKPIREVPLSNGLTLRFFDHTRRYFGDYHQVRIEISCELPLTPDLFDDQAACAAALKVLGPSVRYLKQVEHQGVATAAVQEAVERVIGDFLSHSLGYFQSPAFPKKLVHSELNRVRGRRKAFSPLPANG